MTTPPADRPFAALFACTQNSIRSPMAEALMRSMCGARAVVASCGVYGGGDDPFAVEVMREMGLDVAGRVSRRFEDLPADARFDCIVALTDEAEERARAFVAERGMNAEILRWPTPDPAAGYGGRAQVLDAYRAVRDALAARIRARFGDGEESA